MQNARDTFYVTLRDRLAAVNPARTMVVRRLLEGGGPEAAAEFVGSLRRALD